MSASMKRRNFITLLGGAAAWPLAASAQQAVFPVIGFLTAGVRGRDQQIAAFHASLKEMGYVDTHNVVVEFRSAEGQFARFPALAADLVRQRAALLVAVSNDAALAANGATTTVPIVFGLGGDPVALGLVRSLNRPGGNATGIYFFTQGLEAKRSGPLAQNGPDRRHDRCTYKPELLTRRKPVAGCAGGGGPSRRTVG